MEKTEPLKMTQELKDKWLAALRGGEYVQGKGYLNNEGRMCCLGVLCDVIDPTEWVASSNRSKDVLGIKQITPTATHVEAWVLPQKYLHLIPVQVRVKLIEMNDGSDPASVCKDKKAPSSFLEIADYIEARLPVVEGE